MNVLTLKFDMTLEDLVAFSNFHLQQSPSHKRGKWLIVFLLALVVFGITVWNYPPITSDTKWLVIYAINTVIVIVFTLLYVWFYDRILQRQIRTLYTEGTNHGLIGPHELSVDPEWISNHTPFYEERHRWQAIDRIVENDAYIFIYITSISAHIVPKIKVPADQAEAFLTLAVKHFKHACPTDANVPTRFRHALG